MRFSNTVSNCTVRWYRFGGSAIHWSLWSVIELQTVINTKRMKNITPPTVNTKKSIMIIGVNSQVEIYHLTSILQLSGPVVIPESGGALPHVTEYDGQYRFFVIARHPSIRTQIEQCLTFLPDTNRILLLLVNWQEGPIPDNVFIVNNVDELEELMVLPPLDAATKNKIATRIFGQFSSVQLGFQVLQQLTGRYDMTLEEFVGGPDAAAEPRVEILQEEEYQYVRVKRVCEDTCSICLLEPSTVMLDCGHDSMCLNCAEKWIKQTGQCPICKQYVVKIYSTE
jgi:hypothetical protein